VRQFALSLRTGRHTNPRHLQAVTQSAQKSNDTYRQSYGASVAFANNYQTKPINVVATEGSPW